MEQEKYNSALLLQERASPYLNTVWYSGSALDFADFALFDTNLANWQDKFPEFIRKTVLNDHEVN